MSVYDVTDCPPDPLEHSRERIRNLMVRENPGDPWERPIREPVLSPLSKTILHTIGSAIACGSMVALFWAGLNIR